MRFNNLNVAIVFSEIIYSSVIYGGIIKTSLSTLSNPLESLNPCRTNIGELTGQRRVMASTHPAIIKCMIG